MGLRYNRAPNGKPNCYESADVQMIDGVRDIPFEGSLSAVLVPTDSERECRQLGLIFDGRTTLIVDCLHSDDEVRAFRFTCAENRISIAERTTSIMTPCPPPTNQTQVEDWAAKLFSELRSPSS